VSYFPQFWGFGVIYKAHDAQYIFERDEKNLSFLRFRAIFMNYCPQFWGSRLIYKVHDTQYMFERDDKKLVVFAF
jgi:hypothetical protein